MSGRKNVIKSNKVVSAGSLAGDYTSPVTIVQYLDNIGIQLNVSGTPVGDFEVQFSGDYAVNEAGYVTNAGNWIPVDFGSSVSVSGSPDFIYLDLNQMPGPAMRVFYDRTSGTGSVDMYVTAKEI